MYSILTERKLNSAAKLNQQMSNPTIKHFLSHLESLCQKVLTVHHFFSLAGATAEKVASENLIVIYSIKLG